VGPALQRSFIQAHAARATVLDAAYAATPERFVRQPPIPPALPGPAWINKPAENPPAEREEPRH